MIIAIDKGHNCFPDTGAIGIKNEDALTLEVGNLLIEKFALNHKVIDVTPSTANSVRDSLARRTSKANNSLADFYISIHFNAYDGHACGTEVFAMGAVSVAASVVNKIASLGFKNRGVKDGKNLYVIKYTAMPAILVECCFCDSKKDMQIYNAEKMVQAIYDGVIQQEV